MSSMLVKLLRSLLRPDQFLNLVVLSEVKDHDHYNMIFDEVLHTKRGVGNKVVEIAVGKCGIRILDNSLCLHA